MAKQPPTKAASPLPQRMPLPPRPKLDEGIRRIRNKLREYSARSVVEAGLRQLWSDRGSELEGLRAAPWILLGTAELRRLHRAGPRFQIDGC